MRTTTNTISAHPKPTPKSAPKRTNESLRRLQIGAMTLLIAILLAGLAGFFGAQSRDVDSKNTLYAPEQSGGAENTIL